MLKNYRVKKCFELYCARLENVNLGCVKAAGVFTLAEIHLFRPGAI